MCVHSRRRAHRQKQKSRERFSGAVSCRFHRGFPANTPQSVSANILPGPNARTSTRPCPLWLAERQNCYLPDPVASACDGSARSGTGFFHGRRGRGHHDSAWRLTHVDSGFLLLRFLGFATSSVFVSHGPNHATGMPTPSNRILSARSAVVWKLFLLPGAGKRVRALLRGRLFWHRRLQIATKFPSNWEGSRVWREPACLLE